VLSLRIEELERRVGTGGRAPAPATKPTVASAAETGTAREAEHSSPSSSSGSTGSSEDDHPPRSGNGAPNGSTATAARTEPSASPPQAPDRDTAASGESSSPAAQALAVEEAQASAAGGDGASALDLDALRALWPAVVDAVRSDNAMVAALLVEARPSKLDERRLTVGLQPGAGFTKRKVEEHAGLVREALRRLTGRPLAVAFELSDGHGDGAGTEPARLLAEEELLERLKEEFGAREIFDDEAPTREE
jgi:DNA polymerase III subunit gamma/tau